MTMRTSIIGFSSAALFIALEIFSIIPSNKSSNGDAKFSNTNFSSVQSSCDLNS